MSVLEVGIIAAFKKFIQPKKEIFGLRFRNSEGTKKGAFKALG